MTDTTNSISAKAPSDATNKAVVAFRYLASNATGGLAVFVALGTLSPEQQVEILKSANTIYNSSRDIVGAFANIWYIVFPIIAIYLGKLGVSASGIGTMMDKVFAMAKAGNLEAKVAIVNAASSPAIGTQAIVNPELAPLPSTAGNVVSSPAAVTAVLPQNPAPAS